MLSYCICSFVRNGAGLGLSTFGILLLHLLHHVNLHTIQEPPKTTRYPRISLKLTISFMFVLLFRIIAGLFSILFPGNIYVLHFLNILSLITGWILIPKYFINQNENLKLYVSVYHWVPAPLLPWQLPKDFNPNSVKLICVDYPNNE